MGLLMRIPGLFFAAAALAAIEVPEWGFFAAWGLILGGLAVAVFDRGTRRGAIVGFVALVFLVVVTVLGMGGTIAGRGSIPKPSWSAFVGIAPLAVLVIPGACVVAMGPKGWAAKLARVGLGVFGAGIAVYLAVVAAEMIRGGSMGEPYLFFVFGGIAIAGAGVLWRIVEPGRGPTAPPPS